MSAARWAMLAGLGLFAGGARAQWTPFYTQNFEAATIPAEWITVGRLTYSPNFSKFIGRHNHNLALLVLPSPVENSGSNGGGSGGSGGSGGTGDMVLYRLTFDLYLFDSWDGDGTAYGPDWFAILSGSTQIFRHNFTNFVPGGQSYPFPPTIGPAPLDDFSDFNDSIYRQISVQFTLPRGQQVRLTFQDENLQELRDESWGLDNVSLAYQVIPAPGGLAALGAAGLLASRRRRR